MPMSWELLFPHRGWNSLPLIKTFLDQVFMLWIALHPEIIISSMEVGWWSYGISFLCISVRYSLCNIQFYNLFTLIITLSYNEANSGVACNLQSPGFHVLCKMTEEAVVHVKPYSITGSLPLIRELQVQWICLS